MKLVIIFYLVFVVSCVQRKHKDLSGLESFVKKSGIDLISYSEDDDGSVKEVVTYLGRGTELSTEQNPVPELPLDLAQDAHGLWVARLNASSRIIPEDPNLRLSKGCYDLAFEGKFFRVLVDPLKHEPHQSQFEKIVDFFATTPESLLLFFVGQGCVDDEGALEVLYDNGPQSGTLNIASLKFFLDYAGVSLQEQEGLGLTGKKGAEVKTPDPHNDILFPSLPGSLVDLPLPRSRLRDGNTPAPRLDNSTHAREQGGAIARSTAAPVLSKARQSVATRSQQQDPQFFEHRGTPQLEFRGIALQDGMWSGHVGAATRLVRQRHPGAVGVPILGQLEFMANHNELVSQIRRLHPPAHVGGRGFEAFLKAQLPNGTDNFIVNVRSREIVQWAPTEADMLANKGTPRLEVDGSFNGYWYEAKSGRYWEDVCPKPEACGDLLHKLMVKRNVALEHGSQFAVISNAKIP